MIIRIKTGSLFRKNEYFSKAFQRQKLIGILDEIDEAFRTVYGIRILAIASKIWAKKLICGILNF